MTSFKTIYQVTSFKTIPNAFFQDHLTSDIFQDHLPSDFFQDYSKWFLFLSRPSTKWLLSRPLKGPILDETFCLLLFRIVTIMWVSIRGSYIYPGMMQSAVVTINNIYCNRDQKHNVQIHSSQMMVKGNLNIIYNMLTSRMLE